ncbi:MAG: hypothetical protein LBC68_12040 [Prevotellaceae bacterium]|jgi:hypothetical protein|nr:hypothetical protein [Prevotellaceae bacterium]
MVVKLNLCLSDIPKEYRFQDKNGKWYCNLLLYERQEKGKYEETHTIKVSKTAAQQELDDKTYFVGSGIVLKPKTPQAAKSV